MLVDQEKWKEPAASHFSNQTGQNIARYKREPASVREEVK